MLVAEGLGHIEIWQRGYKPPATVYIDNKGVNFDGDWDATLDRVLDLIAPIAVKKVEERYALDRMTVAGWERLRREYSPPEDLFDDSEPESVQDVFDEFFSVPVYAYPGEETSRTILVEDRPFIREVDRHPSSARFHEILRELGELHDEKSVGYGTDDDPLANVRSSSEWGIPAWQGAMIRAGDKIKRLQAHASKGDLPFEAIEDAFKDLAVYSVIGLVLYEQEQSAPRKEVSGA